MKIMTRRHFKFLAEEIAPLLNPVHIRNGDFARKVREFSKNNKFDYDKFNFVSKNSWNDVNQTPDCHPDDVGVLEKDYPPTEYKEAENGSNSRAA